MRVLIVGRSRRRDVESWILRAARRAGHTATLVDDRKVARTAGNPAASLWLKSRVALFCPDRMIVSKPLSVSATTIHEICQRVPTTMWYRDLTIPADARVIERARYTETTFLTAGGQAAEFEAGGVPRARFLPDGVEPEVDRMMAHSAAFECDVAFLGDGRDPYRRAFLTRVARHFHLRTWGNRWEGAQVNWAGGPAYGDDVGRICASAKVVLGVERDFQREAQVFNYSSNRMWRVLCAGGFYLGFAAPGLRDLLRDHEHLAFYDDEDHALEQLSRYVADAAARLRIREAGRRFVLEHHTIHHRLENLLTGTPFRNPLEPVSAP